MTKHLIISLMHERSAHRKLTPATRSKHRQSREENKQLQGIELSLSYFHLSRARYEGNENQPKPTSLVLLPSSDNQYDENRCFPPLPSLAALVLMSSKRTNESYSEDTTKIYAIDASSHRPLDAREIEEKRDFQNRHIILSARARFSHGRYGAATKREKQHGRIARIDVFE